MQAKPTLYPDTNILSVLHYSGGNVAAVAKHLKTKDWWTHERKNFALVSSNHTERELIRGSYRGQFRAVSEARRMHFLAPTHRIDKCAEIFLEQGVVPAGELGDAIQLAFATIYRIDYLLTWNYAHLANTGVQRRLDWVNAQQNWRSPLVVSPETIPWATFGQDVRREDGP